MIKSVVALVVIFALCVVIDRLRKKSISFAIRILLATVMGTIVELTSKGATNYIVIFGRVFIGLLQALVIPLLLFSIITTVTSLEGIEKLRSAGGKITSIPALHNVLAPVATLILSKLINLGVNTSIKMDVTDKIREVPSLSDVFVSLFPKNIVDSMLHIKVIPIIVFVAIIGVTALRYSNKDGIKPFMDFVTAADKVTNKMVGGIIEFTPYTVLSLSVHQIATLDLSLVTSLLLLLLMIYVCCFFYTFITTTVVLGSMTYIDPFKFQHKFFPAWLLGFTAQSSLGVLPENIREQEKMGVPTEIVSSVTSIGTIFGMPDCAAVWNILLATFTINAFSIPSTMIQYIIMVLAALLTSAGTVEVPGTGATLNVVLSTITGLPLETILVLSLIQDVADMACTSINIHVGGLTGVIVTATQHDLDLKKYSA